MKTKSFVLAVVGLLMVTAASTGVFTAEKPADRTLTTTPVKYVPTLADLNYSGTTVGDVAEADIQALGDDLAYIGLVLNADGVNAGLPHLFLKAQQDGTEFKFGACYLGHNGSAGEFGLGFFPLSQPFIGAHMRAARSDSTVTIEFTNVNGGLLPNQSYVCSGAPAPVGDKIGVLGLHPLTHTPRIAKFSDGSTVLDDFNYLGALGNTGNWNDVAPGMHAHFFFAEAGHELNSMSFWKGEPRLKRVRPSSGAQGTTMYLRLTGLNFRLPGTTVNVSGTGVNVVMVNVDGKSTSTHLTAKLVIDPGAPVGTRGVTVTTPAGQTKDAQPFTITGSPAACPVSLPLTASGSAGTLNVTAGIGATRFTSGRWVAGWMVFNPRSVLLYGTTLYSGFLPATNPPVTRTLSANVGPVPAVAAVNSFYSPYLCGNTLTWASTDSSATPYEPVPRSDIDVALRSIDFEDFNGTYVEIPR